MLLSLPRRERRITEHLSALPLRTDTLEGLTSDPGHILMVAEMLTGCASGANVSERLLSQVFRKLTG